MSDMHNRDTELCMMRENIAIMNELCGFSVVVVCCSNEALAAYWQKRLESGAGSIVPRDSIMVAVFEDWPGGAGNGRLYDLSYFFFCC